MHTATDQAVFTNRDGLELWYRISGQGPLCVFVSPGWGPSVDYAFLTLTPLERRFTMAYLDSRGSGRSQRPATTRQYLWRDFTGDLEDFRRHLDADGMWLVAHSWGCLYALQYTLQHPRHVSGLILIGGAVSDPRQREEDTRARLHTRRNEPGIPEAIEAMGRTPGSQDELNMLMEVMMPAYFSDREAAERFGPAARAMPMSYDAWCGREECQIPIDLSDRLAEVTVPALVIVGTDDAICSPAQAQRLHFGLPNSKLLLIEHAGHMPWIERPEEFHAGIARFHAMFE